VRSLVYSASATELPAEMAAAANDFAGGGGEVVEISSSSESEAASDVAACNNAVALIEHRILLSAAGHIADTAIELTFSSMKGNKVCNNVSHCLAIIRTRPLTVLEQVAMHVAQDNPTEAVILPPMPELINDSSEDSDAAELPTFMSDDSLGFRALNARHAHAVAQRYALHRSVDALHFRNRIPAVVAHSSLHARSKSRSETPPAPKQRRAALPPSPTAAGVSGGLAGECCQMHTTPYLVV